MRVSGAAGHGRVMAAQLLGMAEVPVIELAMIPFAPSTRTGLVQPNSVRLAARAATCSGLWVRALAA